MRFLCLHGWGTNNKVLEMQTSAIRYDLDSSYSYDYAEGTISCRLAPELESVLPKDGQYFQYGDSPQSMLKALRDLDQFLEREGPFDALLAFSHGAQLASTYLIQQAIEKENSPMPVKCAIFFSTGAPLDPMALQRGVWQSLHLSRVRRDVLRKFATAHIWGQEDWMRDQSEILYALCDPDARFVYVHDTGHQIPTSTAGVLGSIRVIRRAIDRAENM